MKITLEVDMSNYTDTKVLIGAVEHLLVAIANNKAQDEQNQTNIKGEMLE